MFKCDINIFGFLGAWNGAVKMIQRKVFAKDKRRQNYSQTLYGHPLNRDTPLLRTVFFVPGECPYTSSKFNLLKGTMSAQAHAWMVENDFKRLAQRFQALLGTLEGCFFTCLNFSQGWIVQFCIKNRSMVITEDFFLHYF